jgi:PAS domain S-box-containing protein
MDHLAVPYIDRSNHPFRAQSATQTQGGQTRAAFQAGEVRRLLEQAPGFIAVVRGTNFVFEMVNAAFVELVGRRDFIGRPAREAWPELGEDSFDQLRQVYASGQPLVGRGVPVAVRREQGRPVERRYIDFVYQAITGSDGAVTGIFLQGQDVTDQKRTEEQLRLALRGGRIAAWSRDLTTNHVSWSDNSREVLGIGDGPASDFMKRIHPEDRDYQREALARMMSDGTPYGIEVRFIKPDGSVIWIEHRAELRRGPDGLDSLTGITADITARKTAEIEVRESEERYRKDLEAAAAVQRGLLPPDGVTGNLRHQGLLEPSTFIGGDALNVIRRSDGQLSFFHIDVCGHGAAAALVSVAAYRLISEAAMRDASLRPENLVQEAARAWPEDLPFFTMVYGQIDPVSGQGSLVQAGHPHPLLVRRGGSIEPLGQGGLPIGIDTAASYEAVPFALAPGDALLLYSDGIVEAENAAGEIFSEERLHALIRQHRDSLAVSLLGSIAHQVQRWSRSKRLDDDVSALLLERIR